MEDRATTGQPQKEKHMRKKSEKEIKPKCC